MESVVLALGGLGVEKKIFINEHEERVVYTLGGSAWHIAFSSRALGCKSSILAEIGSDDLGYDLFSVLKMNEIEFVGTKSSKTQEYQSIIKDGNSVQFVASLDNITKENVIKCFSNNLLESDILVIGYISSDILPYILNKRNLFKVLCLNMSSSIMLMSCLEIIQFVPLFNIITMNISEAKQLSYKFNLEIEGFLKKLSTEYNYVFVTSNEYIIYVINKHIDYYKFTSLNNVIDSTGAGDAFATSIAICINNNMSLFEGLKQAVYSSHCMCGVIEENSINKSVWKL